MRTVAGSVVTMDFDRAAHTPRNVDVRLPGKRNSNSHGARPVHLNITMIKWIRTRRLSIKNSLSAAGSVVTMDFDRAAHTPTFFFFFFIFL